MPVPVYCYSGSRLIDILPAYRAPMVGEELLKTEMEIETARYKVKAVCQETGSRREGTHFVCHCQVDVLKREETKDYE